MDLGTGTGSSARKPPASAADVLLDGVARALLGVHASAGHAEGVGNDLSLLRAAAARERSRRGADEVLLHLTPHRLDPSASDRSGSDPVRPPPAPIVDESVPTRSVWGC